MHMLSIFKTSQRASACADMRQETQWSTPLWGNANHEQLIQQGQLCFLESICSVIGNHLSLYITAPIWVPIVFSSQSLLYLYWTIGYCSFDFLFNLLPTKWVHKRHSIWQSIVRAHALLCSFNFEPKPKGILSKIIHDICSLRKCKEQCALQSKFSYWCRYGAVYSTSKVSTMEHYPCTLVWCILWSTECW